jgi:hypothetical protein
VCVQSCCVSAHSFSSSSQRKKCHEGTKQAAQRSTFFSLCVCLCALPVVCRLPTIARVPKYDHEWHALLTLLQNHVLESSDRPDRNTGMKCMVAFAFHCHNGYHHRSHPHAQAHTHTHTHTHTIGIAIGQVTSHNRGYRRIAHAHSHTRTCALEGSSPRATRARGRDRCADDMIVNLSFSVDCAVI